MERGGERGRDRQREVERERWRERGGERERWRDRETERETRMNAANQNPNKPKTVSRVRFLLSAVAENQQWHHRIITISTKLGPSLLLFDVILVRSSKPAHWLLHTHTHTHDWHRLAQRYTGKQTHAKHCLKRPGKKQDGQGQQQQQQRRRRQKRNTNHPPAVVGWHGMESKRRTSGWHQHLISHSSPLVGMCTSSSCHLQTKRSGEGRG